MVCEHSRTVCEQIGLICEQISMIFKQNSMEKKLIRTRFSRAVGSYPQAAVVQRDVARRMAGLLHTYLPPAKCRNALEVGCGTGLFTRMLLREVRPQHLMLNDICTNVQSYFTDILGADVSFCGGDAERVPFPAGQDLIASCSALQWFNDPEAFFERCRRPVGRRLSGIQHIREGEYAGGCLRHRHVAAVSFVGGTERVARPAL